MRERLLALMDYEERFVLYNMASQLQLLSWITYSFNPIKGLQDFYFVNPLTTVGGIVSSVQCFFAFVEPGSIKPVHVGCNQSSTRPHSYPPPSSKILSETVAIDWHGLSHGEHCYLNFVEFRYHEIFRDINYFVLIMKYLSHIN